MYQTNTIAAISTSMSNSGIGIVRISGDESINIADKIFVSINNNKKLIDVKSHTVHYGNIVDGDNVIDEVLVIVMKAPNTYTKEDVVEIDCHGGIIVVKKILDLVIKNGARIAEPGEFTKRAFLNGRIDLSQAEAVIDVINAKNDIALKQSVNQLKGSISNKIKDMREKIIYHIAFIESALDDPEHISIDGYSDKLLEDVNKILKDVEKLIKSADNGRLISEGIRTVIVGKPNVGKSSLLNVLLGEERAIVTDIAGTTRDTLEESIRMQGITLNIVDTAGIRDTEDIVEKIGVDKAKDSVSDADLILFVIDSSRELDEDDEEIIELIKDKKTILILNKTDLDNKINEEIIKNKTGLDSIPISATNEEGIDILEDKIKEMFYSGDIDTSEDIYITNARHKALIENSYESLKMVVRSIEDGMPEDFYSIDLMNAYEQLGIVIGEAVEDDLVNEIFSKFCMGK
ncbi:MAG: tRNA uridine-5-carboxymethylaminomethyl(34) synthesis GTPase MnmE [Lachnospiraceae bacterium]|nr:tRNA uridine-5-carboxymethylaminomethyl(34) synthesis GTPase MnmE [Lachnospiraceae bacterium]